MASVNKLDFKNKEQVRKHLIKNYLTIDNNIFISNKLFIANSALNWIYDNTKNPEVVKHYILDIYKYLKGEYELAWIKGILTKKKVIKNDKI
jgi:hypothetical protein